MSYTLTYRINNHDLPDPVRTIEVEATPEQIAHLVEEGYLVRERLVQGAFLEELRAAVDELAAAEGAANATSNGGHFGGLFIRNLPDRHPTFQKLIRYSPFLSIARAALGPQVQIHGTVIRVTYPGQPNQETHWHFHQRIVPDPLPPLFARSRVLDNLLYLDDIDDATGPFCLVPRSHLRMHMDVPAGYYGDFPDQIVLRVPAGSCITADAGLSPGNADTARRKSAPSDHLGLQPDVDETGGHAKWGDLQSSPGNGRHGDAGAARQSWLFLIFS